MQMGFVDIVTQCVDAMGCFYQYCLSQDAWPALTDEDFQRGKQKSEMDEMRKQSFQGRGYSLVEMWEC